MREPTEEEVQAAEADSRTEEIIGLLEEVDEITLEHVGKAIRAAYFAGYSDGFQVREEERDA